MALFASRYLASKPFDLKAFGDIQTYALSGYYNIHDYAVTSWCHHTEEAIARSSSLSADLFLEVIHFLSAHLRFHLEVQAGDFPDHPTPGDILHRFRQLSTNGRARQEFGNLSTRTLAIREVIEAIWALMPHNPDMQKSIGLQMYGPKQFKCCNTWCNWFSDGFQGVEQRRAHIDQHNRPFRCPVDDCFAGALGFPSEQQLQQHATRHHGEAEKLLFPTTLFIKKHSNLAAAIRAGDLEAVKSTIQEFIAVTGAYKTSTTLTLAVNWKHFDICQHLLEEGALPNSQDFQAAIAQNDADILGLLVSHIPSTELANLDPGSLYAADKDTQRMVVRIFELHHPRSMLYDSFVLKAIKQDRLEIVKSFLDCEDDIIRQRLKADYHAWMQYIMESSQECLQALLSIDKSGVLVKQVFFEAHTGGNESMLSCIPSVTPELSDWICLQGDQTSCTDNLRYGIISKALVQVVSKSEEKNIWAFLGTSFHFLPLDGRLGKMNRVALREMLNTDDSLFHQKDERGATLLHGFIDSGDVEMVQFATSVKGVDINTHCEGPDDGGSLSPIRLALKRIGHRGIDGCWASATIVYSLLGTGRVNLSEMKVDDELACLMAAGGIFGHFKQPFVGKGLSQLCPTAREDQIRSLVTELPRLANEFNSFLFSSPDVADWKRNFSLQHLVANHDLYFIFEKMFRQGEYTSAVKIFRERSRDCLLTPAERVVFLKYAIQVDDSSLLTKLLTDSTAVKTAIFMVAARGSPNLFHTLLGRGIQFNIRNDAGLTPLEVAQSHLNQATEEWLENWMFPKHVPKKY